MAWCNTNKKEMWLFLICLVEILLVMSFINKITHWRKNIFLVSQVYQFSSVQSLTHVRLFVTPWIAACQAFLSITNCQSLLKLMSIELVMPSSHLILCRPLLLCPQSLPASGFFPVRKKLNSSHEVAKVLEFQLQHQSFQWTPRTDLL